MAYYPIVIELSGKKCLVVGGGRVALRKVRSLLEAGARVTVIAPKVVPELVDMENVHQLARSYKPGDAKGFALVFAATDDPAVNAVVAEDAVANGVLVNVADAPELCSFIAPAVVRRGDLLIAVTTCGKSPALSRKIREEIESRYGSEYGLLVDLLGRLRQLAKSKFSSQEQREKALKRVIESDVVALLRQGLVSEAEKKALECLESM
ncbi:MAG: bifunctional precorrin-2 dehydrogenase/sirohydrochlorin ferrochelatase [Armatimonadota bacterium]|nr:bifunctional precorrin-2 dehydrogenase/sirohydrochlorin ferrochelatase [Armatimonadota bacterium]